MSSDENKKTIRNRLKSALPALGRAVKKTNESKTKAKKYRLMYEHFREILNINDSTLQFIADVEDKLLGRSPFALPPLFLGMRDAVMNAYRMVNSLNQIADGRYYKLYETLNQLQLELETESAKRPKVASGPLIIPLTELSASDAESAGRKMANLGEVRPLGFEIPEGFAITTNAFAEFMSHNNLWEKATSLEDIQQIYNPLVLERACRDIQMAILAAPIPPRLESEIFAAFDALSGGQEILVAMRSSAVGEDSSASHAGQYYTELNVPRELLLYSYRTVLSSAYNLDAVLYRFERGLNDRETIMAVGCIRMVDAARSGIIFSREFNDPDADHVVISATPGLSAGITSGAQAAEEIVLSESNFSEVKSSYLSASDMERLWNAARILEKHFGAPQDIEWAIDEAGKLFILQSRPMVMLRQAIKVAPETMPEKEPLLSGGYSACPGAGTGPVFQVRKDADLEMFPHGAVIVSQRSSPTFSRVMPRCAAIVTEVGSPIGHMAILSREFNVPTIVGMKGAMKLLESGRIITVDATSCKVYDGAINIGTYSQEAAAPLADSPVVQRLRRIARLITPLNLTDPTSPEFSPAGCRSLHDMTRFAHEKLYEIMFRFGDQAAQDHQNSFKLDAHLPLRILMFDVGGGVAEGAGESGVIKPEDILSVPMKAFLEGLLDDRIKWDQPRPVSARGFLSVLGENMAGPPAVSRGVGSASFAVVSDRYMNFSTKAGYHFSTVDVYCGKSINKNYIHFRFEGGGAAPDRRLRRVKFLSEVLSRLDFRVQYQGDFLVARMDKYEHDFICSRLTSLGRLTMCARQLDMLMGSDTMASQMAQAFLKDEMCKF